MEPPLATVAFTSPLFGNKTYEKVKIDAKFDLNWLSKVDPGSSVFNGNFIVHLSWFDQRFKMNNTEENSFIEIPGSEIWTPSTSLLQKIASDTKINLKDLGLAQWCKISF